MSLHAIGVGFGRTGMVLLKVVLEQLGFTRCEHMFNLLAGPSRGPQWLEAARRQKAAEPIHWEALLGGCRATVDRPGDFFWRVLVAALPDAKVVLTVRGSGPLVCQRWRDHPAPHRAAGCGRIATPLSAGGRCPATGDRPTLERRSLPGNVPRTGGYPPGCYRRLRAAHR